MAFGWFCFGRSRIARAGFACGLALAVLLGMNPQSGRAEPWRPFLASSRPVSGAPEPFAPQAFEPVNAGVSYQPVSQASSTPPWSWQVLPDGLIYRSYLAGAKEPRMAAQFVHEAGEGWIWDITLGGRVGLLRYGTKDRDRPDGWQIDLEGAGMPRLDLETDRDLVAVDFRAGIPITYGRGPYQTKFGYYHLSSHLGDEYMVRYPNATRVNFVREVLYWGHSYYVTDDLRLYGEAAWAFASDGGSEPWEFQFGIDYSPAGPSGIHGDPFVALNAHLRQEHDYGGNLVVQTGWQWRGESGHLFRAGMHYYVGMSDQFQFFDRYEDKLGMGVWYDY